MKEIKFKDTKYGKSYLCLVFKDQWMVMNCSKQWYGKVMGNSTYCALKEQDIDRVFTLPKS
jgi:hypothetical protein